jgi:hypothetical protein
MPTVIRPYRSSDRLASKLRWYGRVIACRRWFGGSVCFLLQQPMMRHTTSRRSIETVLTPVTPREGANLFVPTHFLDEKRVAHRRFDGGNLGAQFFVAEEAADTSS